MAKYKRARSVNGSLFQRKRKIKGHVYYDDYVILTRDESGARIRIPLGTNIYAEAKEKYAQWLADRAAGDRSAIDGRGTVIDYLDNWLRGKRQESNDFGKPRPVSLVHYKSCCDVLIVFLKASRLDYLRLNELAAKHITEFQAWRLKQTRFGKEGGTPITPEGVNRLIKTYGVIFHTAFRDRLISKNPVRGIRPLTTTPRKIQLPDERMLFEVFQRMDDPAVRDYVTALALTGMRAMEGMSRKFKHFDLERGILQIRDDGDFRVKTPNSNRDIPLPNELAAIVRRIQAERKDASPEDYVFVLPDGRPLMQHKDCAYHRLIRTLDKVNADRRRAGQPEMPRFNFRLLRHWFISWALNRPDNPLTEIQLIKIVGHADFDMIRRTYYHLDADGETGRKMRETPLFAGLDGTVGGRASAAKAAAGKAETAAGMTQAPGMAMAPGTLAAPGLMAGWTTSNENDANQSNNDILGVMIASSPAIANYVKSQAAWCDNLLAAPPRRLPNKP